MKKILILLLLLLSSIAYSQNCNAIITVDDDKMTDYTTYFSKDVNLVSGGEAMSVYLSKTGILKTLNFHTDGCVDGNNSVIILLRDGSKHTFKGENSFNCDGYTYFFYGEGWDGEEFSKKLLTTEIEAIRIYTYKGIVHHDLTKNQSLKLLHRFQCIEK